MMIEVLALNNSTSDNLESRKVYDDHWPAVLVESLINANRFHDTDKIRTYPQRNNENLFGYESKKA